jgi:hypothetical protein
VKFKTKGGVIGWVIVKHVFVLGRHMIVGDQMPITEISDFSGLDRPA